MKIYKKYFIIFNLIKAFSRKKKKKKNYPRFNYPTSKNEIHSSTKPNYLWESESVNILLKLKNSLQLLMELYLTVPPSINGTLTDSAALY